MSVLIKGMEMPKEGCKDCLLVKRKGVFDICPFLKREVDGNVERGGKPLGCPLVPVPPHGRLIDADALLSQYTGYFWTAKTDYAEGLRDVANDIKQAPTIIEAEEEQE